MDSQSASIDQGLSSLNINGSDAGSGTPSKAPSTGAYEGRYNGSEVEQVCAWIHELLGVELDPTNLQPALKSGKVLCELVNRISPKAVKKINSSEMPFAQRENIQSFSDAVRTLGVKDINNFAADDLYEAKNMKQVVICILALGKQAWFVSDYNGPCIGRPDISQISIETKPAISPLPKGGASSDDSHANRKYKWDVKPGGSYVPTVPSLGKKEDTKESEEHRQRKWEVKFAPQLATATRRTLVVTSDVMNYMNQFSNENQLRTAMGGGGQSEAQPPKKEPVPQHVNKTAIKPAPVSEAEESVEVQETNQDTAEREENFDEKEESYNDEGDDDDLGDDDGSLYKGIPPAGVIEGLMMMLNSPDATEKAKAAAALCNICSETDPNRELVVQAGGLPSLIDMLKNPSPEVPFMQSAAAACLCNLAANMNSKEIIATSGALEVLVDVLKSDNQAAAAQAAGALWSLCVDNDMNKQRVADAGAIPHLITLLYAPDTFAQSQSAGALSECSIRNDNNKKLISEHGAILPLVKMLRSPDLSVQRLSSCAICNVCANHEANKKEARERGALPVLVHLLSTSQVPEVLSPVAGAICNLSMKCAENRAEFIRLGAAEILRHYVPSPVPSLHGNALAALEQLELG